MSAIVYILLVRSNLPPPMCIVLCLVWPRMLSYGSPSSLMTKGGIVGAMLWVLVVGGFFNDGGVLRVSSSAP
jgi:hypothetical protein